MKLRIAATVLTLLACVTTPRPGWADYPAGVLISAEKRAYHACLYATYIHDYCRFHAWGPGIGAYNECVIANRAGRIGIGFAYWGPGIEFVCRNLVEDHYLRSK